MATDANDTLSPRYVVKMTFFGQPGVGKTGIWMTYREQRSLEELGYTGDPSGKRSIPTTIGVEFASKDIKIGEHAVRLMLHDTAGQERYASISLSYVRGSHGVILVYDVTNRESFDRVQFWNAQVQSRVQHGEEPLVLLIGNKSDLAGMRAVPTEEAKAEAERLNYFFFETSAFKNTNVQEAINHFAAACFSHRVQLAKKKALSSADVPPLPTIRATGSAIQQQQRSDSPGRWLDSEEDRKKMAAMGVGNYGSARQSGEYNRRGVPALVIDGKTKNYRHYTNGTFRDNNNNNDEDNDTKHVTDCAC